MVLIDCSLPLCPYLFNVRANALSSAPYLTLLGIVTIMTAASFDNVTPANLSGLPPERFRKS
jgi:hypothetical protein